jgi:MFS family permease
MVLTTLALLVHERAISAFGRNEQGTAGLLMGWMLIVDASLTPFAGRAGDKWHAHARVAVLAMFSLIAGLLVIGRSEHALGLAAGLALVGVGGAGLGPSLLVLMSAVIPRERRGTGVGLLQLCGDVGGMLGPLVGTAIFSGGTAYYVGAAVLGCALPFAFWLAQLERRSRKAASTGPPPP